MRSILSRIREYSGPPWLLLPAAFLGASTGLFIYGYWLRDLSFVGDEQMAALTVAVSVVAGAGYFALVTWLMPNLAALPRRSRCGIALASLPIAGFVLFGGTSNWALSNRYLDFLLPDHHLQLSASPAEAAPGSALVWFNTSLGDVSYGDIEIQGWKRVGDELVVENPAFNGLTWTGDVGDRVQMVFSGASPNVTMTIAWDGKTEIVALSKDKTNYDHTFSVPLYASKTAIMAFGLVSFYALTLGLCVLLWINRSRLAKEVGESMGPERQAPGSLDLWLLIALGLLAASLRVFNLGGVFPAVDEYYHLIAAKQILQGAALGSVYQRGLWIVTLPVSLAMRVFGYQLWAARLVGAIFNVLALIPLYLMTRKINRSIAVLACLLFATSPWIVTFARVAREYAYYPFYFFWIVYAMVLYLEGIPEGFVFLKQWKVLLPPKMLALAIALLLPPVFALKIDWLSTFRTILIAYLAFGFFILLRFNWRERSNWPILALLGVGVALSGRSWYLEQSSKLFVEPQLNALPIQYFLPNPQQQWYLDRVVVVIALGIVAAVVAAFLGRRLNQIPLFVLALFFGYLAIFAFFSRAFFHTRHLLSTELWYVIVVAMGLYVVWRILALLVAPIGKPAQIALAAALMLSVTNFPQIVLPSVTTNPDMPISEDYMHDMTKVQAYMLGEVQPGDVLVSTVYGQYAIWEGSPLFADQYHITSHTPVPDILSYAAQHPAGWIVIDEIRFKLAGLSVRDLSGQDQIQYVGEYGDERVWHWQRNGAQSFIQASLGGGR